MLRLELIWRRGVGHRDPISCGLDEFDKERARGVFLGRAVCWDASAFTASVKAFRVELNISVARASFSAGKVTLRPSSGVARTLTTGCVLAFTVDFAGRLEVLSDFEGSFADCSTGGRSKISKSFKDSTVADVQVAAELAARSRFADCAGSSCRVIVKFHESQLRTDNIIVTRK